MAAKKPAVPQPTHYAVTLAKPFPVPDTPVVVPAGESTVSADIFALIPSDTVIDKTPAEA